MSNSHWFKYGVVFGARKSRKRRRAIYDHVEFFMGDRVFRYAVNNHHGDDHLFLRYLVIKKLRGFEHCGHWATQKINIAYGHWVAAEQDGNDDD